MLSPRPSMFRRSSAEETLSPHGRQVPPPPHHMAGPVMTVGGDFVSLQALAEFTSEHYADLSAAASTSSSSRAASRLLPSPAAGAGRAPPLRPTAARPRPQPRPLHGRRGSPGNSRPSARSSSSCSRSRRRSRQRSPPPALRPRRPATTAVRRLPPSPDVLAEASRPLQEA